MEYVSPIDDRTAEPVPFAPRPETLAGRRVDAARHHEEPRQRAARPGRASPATARRRDVPALEGDLLQACVERGDRAGRDSRRPRRRGPRGLRLVRVVQCARRRTARAARVPDGCDRNRAVRRRGPRAGAPARYARLPDDADPASGPAPHDGRAARTRRRSDAGDPGSPRDRPHEASTDNVRPRKRTFRDCAPADSELCAARAAAAARGRLQGFLRAPHPAQADPEPARTNRVTS